jgi:hypothetical protein
MGDAYQWQILVDHRLWASDVKVGVAISLYLSRSDYEDDGKLLAWPGIDKLAAKVHLDCCA